MVLFGTPVDVWLVLVLAAFAGGAFGAAVGALPSLAITGVLVTIGELSRLTDVAIDSGPLVDATAVGSGITGVVALGPVFGIHVSFAGGAAGAAYAARKGYLDTGFEFYEAKNVTVALGSRPDVLAVAGAFGVLGMVARQVSWSVGLPLDPIAFAVVVSAVVHRLALGYPLIGHVRSRGWLDMSPYETNDTGGSSPDDRQPVADGGGVRTSPNRLVVEPWLPYHYEWPNVAMLGLVVGLLASFLGIVTGSAFLAFGIALAAVLFLTVGVERVPITHHVALPASTVAIALTPTSAGLVVPLLGGAIFGILGALLGELAQRLVYAHGDTHFDPPAVSIVLTTLSIALLSMVGVIDTAVWIPT